MFSVVIIDCDHCRVKRLEEQLARAHTELQNLDKLQLVNTSLFPGHTGVQPWWTSLPFLSCQNWSAKATLKMHLSSSMYMHACTHMHTHMHKCLHIHMHACTHVFVCGCVHAVHACTHTCTNAYTYTRTHAHMYACMNCTCMYTHTHKHTHARTHARMHAHTHKHNPPHTHTLVCSCPSQWQQNLHLHILYYRFSFLPHKQSSL